MLLPFCYWFLEKIEKSRKPSGKSPRIVEKKSKNLEKIEKNRGSQPAPAAVEEKPAGRSWNPFRRRR